MLQIRVWAMAGLVVVGLAGASAVAAEQAPLLRFKVSLSPTGSFEARSSRIQGTVSSGAKGFEATEISLELATLKTGIELRDRHMTQKYLEASKYPKAVVTNVSGQGGKFKAQLSLHGKTSPIEGRYEYRGGPTGPNWIEATFTTRLSDFDIEEPMYMGVGVEDEVEVTALVPAAPLAAGARK